MVDADIGAQGNGFAAGQLARDEHRAEIAKLVGIFVKLHDAAA